MSSAMCDRCGKVAKIGDAHLCIPRAYGKEAARAHEAGVQALLGALGPQPPVEAVRSTQSASQSCDTCRHTCPCTSDDECQHECWCEENQQ